MTLKTKEQVNIQYYASTSDHISEKLFDTRYTCQINKNNSIGHLFSDIRTEEHIFIGASL